MVPTNSIEPHNTAVSSCQERKSDSNVLRRALCSILLTSRPGVRSLCLTRYRRIGTSMQESLALISTSVTCQLNRPAALRHPEGYSIENVFGAAEGFRHLLRRLVGKIAARCQQVVSGSTASRPNRY